MKRILVWSGILLFAVSCFAQKNEVDIVLGNTWSFNPNLTVAHPGGAPVIPGTITASRFTFKIGFTRRLARFKPGDLSLELIASNATNSLTPSGTSVFVVPAAKFSFLPESRVSPFASAGVGFARLSGSNAVAYQFGGGFDVKTPFRFLSFRAEARDFLASQPDPNFFPVIGKSFRNNAMAGGGFVVRF